jgi:outer membrane protein TolC
LDGSNELTAEALVAQVLVRNPSLTQMVAAWQAASARYPQVTSLDDPMFGTTLAPGSIANPNTSFGWRVEVSQKLPWPGKRDLRGQAALAEANAAGHDVDDMRVQLIEAAKHAYSDYYLVYRALDVNAEALRRLKESRDNAAALAKTGRVPDQDFLQADVELGRQRERQLMLERMREVAIARINTLLNAPTNAQLLPSPSELAPLGPVPSVEQLQAAAIANRSELRGLADRMAAAQSELLLEYKEFRPDVEVMAAYDAFWQAPQQSLGPQIGLKMNLPVRRNRRGGAVAEAEARLAQRQAEFEKQKNQINFQVQEAYSQLRESEKVVKLYNESILRAAEANVNAAQSAYANFKVPFLTLIEAQRNLYTLRDRYHEATADLYRRRATLERAVSGPLPSVQ